MVVQATMSLGSGNLRPLGEPLEAVSPQQFRLERSPDRGGWILTDLGAMNPTWANNAPIPPGGLLLTGGEILSIMGKRLLLEIQWS